MSSQIDIESLHRHNTPNQLEVSYDTDKDWVVLVVGLGVPMHSPKVGYALQDISLAGYRWVTGREISMTHPGFPGGCEVTSFARTK